MTPQQLTGPGTTSYAIGPLEFALDEMSVLVAGRRVWLTRRELQVLLELAEHAGQPVHKDERYARVWGRRVRGFKDRSLEVYIPRLRIKLAAASADWDYIHTHHAIGYRLEPEPRREDS
jgi:DNA-binding response OmpR family regulator